MNILYVTSEAVPFCKTGGLADVVGSLAPVLATIDMVIVEVDGAKMMRRFDPECGLVMLSPEL